MRPVLLVHKNNKPSVTALRTLLTVMASNSFKRLSLASEETAMANALPRTKANFDFSGSTWVSDISTPNPGSATMGGVGAANNTVEQWAFSGAAISELDGKVVFFGSGHTDGGDGSIYGPFDPQLAAANINLGGSGIPWPLAQPSCRYIDAWNGSAMTPRPNVATSPQGAQQVAPTTPTGFHQAYWTMPNNNGIAMPVCSHSYHSLKYLPGTRKVLLSGSFGFDGNATSRMNSGWVFSDDTGAVSGPLIASSLPAGADQVAGYLQSDGGNPMALAVNDLDGLPYVSGNPGGNGWRIYSWTNPTVNSTLTLNQIVSSVSIASNLLADAVIVPDPANPSQRIWFQHQSQSAQNDAHFYAITGLNGGTPTINSVAYGSGVVTTHGAQFCHYAYDTKRKVIWMTDGDHLFQITPSAAGLASWAIAQVTGFTGDVPPAPATINPTTPGSVIPSLQYLASEDCLIHVMVAGVRVYKPAGWSPP